MTDCSRISASVDLKNWKFGKSNYWEDYSPILFADWHKELWELYVLSLKVQKSYSQAVQKRVNPVDLEKEVAKIDFDTAEKRTFQSLSTNPPPRTPAPG